MADFEQVSSTTHNGEDGPQLHHEDGMDDLKKLSNEAIAKEVVEEEILDLAGSAQDAIARHKGSLSQFEDSPKGFTELSHPPEAEVVPESVPEPPAPTAAVVTSTVEDATEQRTKEEIVDTILKPEAEQTEEKQEEKLTEEIVDTTPEKGEARLEEAAAIAEPIVVPENPPKAAPVEEPSAAPASSCSFPQHWILDKRDEPAPPSAPPHSLMQFSAALGQKGDSSASISPLSSPHSPDSLEEVSPSENPNHAPVKSKDPTVRFDTCSNDQFRLRGLDKEGTDTYICSQMENHPFSGSFFMSESALGFKSETKSLICPDSRVSPSPNQKPCSSVVPQRQGGSHQEMFEKDTECGASTGSSPSQSPLKPQITPDLSVAHTSSNPTEHWNSPFLASQDNVKTSMDTVSKDAASSGGSGYEPDMLGQSDDDFLFETKKNPFQGFSPIDNTSVGFSHFGDTASDSRVSHMSESPTPDLVQYANEGEMQDDPLLQSTEQSYDSVKVVPDSEPFSFSAQFTTAPKEAEVPPGLPPSLPDILKSSPLNPEKLDSGSSEGSPDPSPIHRRVTEAPKAPVALSPNNPFAFDSTISLLKEMAEETEARAADKAKPGAESLPEQRFGAFDLVKEAQTTPKVKDSSEVDPNDGKFSSEDTAQMDRFECLTFPTGKAPEQSDSESPSADSLSPVLEAMAKNPASFQVEIAEEEVEAADEASEQEVSSEEFEFVERPPRGAIDEFLETLDDTKFAKASDMAMEEEEEEEDMMSTFGRAEMTADVASGLHETGTDQSSSYLLLTQPSDPQRGKAGLEISDLQEPLSQAPLAHSPVGKAETVAEEKGGPKAIKMPNLSAAAVVDLLYWRDVKTTGVVLGATLLLLLSLTVCSIVSVLSYVALIPLSINITFRIYKGILQAIQKSDAGHPFKLYLDKDVALSEELVHKYSDKALGRINAGVSELRRLFMVEDLVDSLKFAMLMWILTYVGSLFNGLTLVILSVVGVFSCPIIYEKHQTQIDHYLALVNNPIKDIVGKFQSKVPGLKKKSE